MLFIFATLIAKETTTAHDPGKDIDPQIIVIIALYVKLPSEPSFPPLLLPPAPLYFRYSPALYSVHTSA